MPEKFNMVPRKQIKTTISQISRKYLLLPTPFLAYVPILRSRLGQIANQRVIKTREGKSDIFEGCRWITEANPRGLHLTASHSEAKVSHRNNACVPWRSMIQRRREIRKGRGLCSFFVGAVFVAILCSIHVEHVETIDRL